jgi:hypothetical protein
VLRRASAAHPGSRRPRWQPGDRLLLAALSRRLSRPAWVSFLVSPETILGWHRELVRRKWDAFGVALVVVSVVRHCPPSASS